MASIDLQNKPDTPALPWAWIPYGLRPWQALLWLIGLSALGVFAIWALASNARLFFTTFLNSLTLAGLYFLVASGFTLVFGLMRNVNLAHGSLYLLGAYCGWVAGEHTGSWTIAVIVGFLVAALTGLLLQLLVFRFMQGQDLRQTLVTIGISIVIADIMLWIWGAEIYTFSPPRWMFGSVALPVVEAYPTYRLLLMVGAISIGLLLWLFLARTRIGMMIRAGVDDRAMLAAAGVNVQLVFAITFAVGAGLAGLGGVIGGSALSISPGEDTRYLLASLMVVIVGGMGSVPGAAIGAILIATAEQYGQAYAPTYGIVFTFVIMAAALAFRPQGLLGRK
jgi:branched-chain amino acid transport system permease protein